MSAKAALRHPPISSPASAHSTGTSAAVVNVQSGSGSRCHKPISTSDTPAPTSSPRHKPRSARATRQRPAAWRSADSMTCNSLMASPTTCSTDTPLASLAG